MINFQTLIATKASRIVTAAKGKPVVEFGSRRAHGPQAAVLAARAGYIGGCAGTSNTLAGYKFKIPVSGTMAHSFLMSFNEEEEAFKEFSSVFPSSYLLVDTYDSIAAVKKIINARIQAGGIRLDSGDLYYQSAEIRRLLDSAGYYDTKIMATGDLNEYIIRDLVKRGALIDSFGVGTELSTSRDDPSMNGVYKLVAIKIPPQLPPKSYTSSKHNNIDDDSKILYKFKTSPGKKTYPGPKQIYRIIQEGIIKQDIIALEHEEQDDDVLVNSEICLLRKFLDKGKTILCEIAPIEKIQKYHLHQISLLPPKFKDLDFVPKEFPVTYSKRMNEIIDKFKLN
jgi:nicotinate phosphoribosyltransferase